MTGINFRIWRKKTERAVTRQHTSRPFCTMTWQQETRYRLRDNSWMVYCLCNVYWRGHKVITLSGNDVAVAKSKARKRCFVESKNGLSLSQIVTLFLPVLVGCRWIEKRLSPHFWAMSPVAKTPWKASYVYFPAQNNVPTTQGKQVHVHVRMFCRWSPCMTSQNVLDPDPFDLFFDSLIF